MLTIWLPSRYTTAETTFVGKPLITDRIALSSSTGKTSNEITWLSKVSLKYVDLPWHVNLLWWIFQSSLYRLIFFSFSLYGCFCFLPINATFCNLTLKKNIMDERLKEPCIYYVRTGEAVNVYHICVRSRDLAPKYFLFFNLYGLHKSNAQQ